MRAVLQGMAFADVPLVAVAKGEGRRPGREKLYIPDRSTPVVLLPGTAALRMIQQVRDEAHRFAITGHRQRRGRTRIGSVLESIPGLGPQRRRALLQHFGGLQGITRAGVNDIARTDGISLALAERIYNLPTKTPAFGSLTGNTSGAARIRPCTSRAVSLPRVSRIKYATLITCAHRAIPAVGVCFMPGEWSRPASHGFTVPASPTGWTVILHDAWSDFAIRSVSRPGRQIMIAVALV